jgi:hemolysin activation/secretion protein
VFAARCLAAAAIFAAPGTVVAADTASPSEVNADARVEDVPPSELEPPRASRTQEKILPPVPPVPAEAAEALPVRVSVRQVVVSGSTVFSAEDFAAVTRPYLNRELTAQDLEALRLALTALYVNRGYINSGAVLPDQRVSDGVVRYDVIEGRLSEITLQGNHWFRPDYLKDRIALGAGPPLNMNSLRTRLQLMLEDERIRRLNAELRPGLGLGESVLQVQVDERPPFRVFLEVNNYQAPQLGTAEGLVTLQHQNLTGHGDVASVQYGRAEGIDPIVDLRYLLPLNRWDTSLTLRYAHNNFAVVEGSFQPLNIAGDVDIYSVGLRQPVYRSPAHELAIAGSVDRESLENSLLGEPFSLVPGAQNGESVVTVLRIAPEWTYRSPGSVMAARSRFSFGTGALGATTSPNGAEPDARFFSWLGQFQYVRVLPLPLKETTFLLRGEAQLANSPLPALEQIGVGGRYSVRGYPEYTLLRDNALIGSMELRIPLVRGRSWADYLEVVPFTDVGSGWNASPMERVQQTLASVGAGLRWGATVRDKILFRPQLEIYWGHALTQVPSTGNTLQDHGWSFQFVVELAQN